jgi:hypothetical protein
MEILKKATLSQKEMPDLWKRRMGLFKVRKPGRLNAAIEICVSVIRVLQPIMNFHSPTIRRQGCCSAKTNSQDTLIFILAWPKWPLNSWLPMTDVPGPME